MKKIILLFLTVLTFSSCQKEETTLTATINPSIKSVRFINTMVGSSSYIKVELTLDVPEKGSLVRIDAIRGTNRTNNVLPNLTTGTYSFVDAQASWPNGNALYYVFILNLANGTEIATNPYQVK